MLTISSDRASRTKMNKNKSLNSAPAAPMEATIKMGVCCEIVYKAIVAGATVKIEE